MDEKTVADIYFKLYQEQCTHGRHHETQRSTVVTASIAIAAGVVGIITLDKKVDFNDFPLTFFLILLGAFTAAFSMKHYDLYRLHMERARNYRDAIDELITKNSLGNNPIKLLKSSADDERAVRRSFFDRNNLRLYQFWALFCILISLIGLILTFFALFHPIV